MDLPDTVGLGRWFRRQTSQDLEAIRKRATDAMAAGIASE